MKKLMVGLLLGACAGTALAQWLPPDPDSPPPSASSYTSPLVWRSKVYDWMDVAPPALTEKTEDAWEYAHAQGDNHAAWLVLDGVRAGYAAD